MTRAAFSLVSALALVAAAGLASPGLAAELAGTTWATDGGGAHVTFAAEDEGLIGRIVWLRKEQETGEPVFDTYNPDVSLQGRALNGVAMVWGFEQTGDESWDGGRIYAADDGKTYNAKMTLEGDTLVVTGCIRWPLCRDTVWTRVLPAIGMPRSLTPMQPTAIGP